ncbi:MAG: hypothetical protein Q9226_008035, partial [Calogaya cf. arnoldii]
GSTILDAGCGDCHVALHFARKGLRVQGIDIVANHVRRARQEIKAQKMEDMVSARVADYHHLDWVPDMSLDGVCTMETFVHAREPEQVLGEFFRILKPGGSIAMHEYWHLDDDELPPGTPKDLNESIKRIDRESAMPTDRRLRKKVLQQMLKEQGFVEVVEKDLSKNIAPTLLLFYVLGYIPYLIICFFGLQARFVNTEAGVQGYRGLKRQLGGYSAVKAKKPLKTVEKRVSVMRVRNKHEGRFHLINCSGAFKVVIFVLLCEEVVPGRCILVGQTHTKFTEAKVNHVGDDMFILAYPMKTTATPDFARSRTTRTFDALGLILFDLQFQGDLWRDVGQSNEKLPTAAKLYGLGSSCIGADEASMAWPLWSSYSTMDYLPERHGK